MEEPSCLRDGQFREVKLRGVNRLRFAGARDHRTDRDLDQLPEENALVLVRHGRLRLRVLRACASAGYLYRDETDGLALVACSGPGGDAGTPARRSRA